MAEHPYDPGADFPRRTAGDLDTGAERPRSQERWEDYVRSQESGPPAGGPDWRGPRVRGREWGQEPYPRELHGRDPSLLGKEDDQGYQMTERARREGGGAWARREAFQRGERTRHHRDLRELDARGEYGPERGPPSSWGPHEREEARRPDKPEDPARERGRGGPFAFHGRHDLRDTGRAQSDRGWRERERSGALPRGDEWRREREAWLARERGDEGRLRFERDARGEPRAAWDDEEARRFERRGEPEGRYGAERFGGAEAFERRRWEEDEARERGDEGRAFPRLRESGPDAFSTRESHRFFTRRDDPDRGTMARSHWRREPLTARELMTRDPHAVRPDAPLAEVARVMREEDCGIVPVVGEGRRLLGVVTDRDLVVRAFSEGRSPGDVRVRDVMTRDVECAHPDQDVHGLIHLMSRARVRRVPVVDHEDRLVGIVAMGDLATRADQDEELQEALERISARRSFWRG